MHYFLNKSAPIGLLAGLAGTALAVGLASAEVVGQRGVGDEGRGLAKALQADSNPLVGIGAPAGGAVMGGVIGGIASGSNAAPQLNALEISRVTSGSEFSEMSSISSLSEAEIAGASRFGVLSQAGPIFGAAVIGATAGYGITPTAAVGCTINDEPFIVETAEECEAKAGRPMAILGRGLHAAKEADTNPLESLSLGAALGGIVGFGAGGIGAVMTTPMETAAATASDEALEQLIANRATTGSALGLASGAVLGAAVGYGLDSERVQPPMSYEVGVAPSFYSRQPQTTITISIPTLVNTAVPHAAPHAVTHLPAGRGLMKAAQLDENPLLAAGVPIAGGIGAGVATGTAVARHGEAYNFARTAELNRAHLEWRALEEAATTADAQVAWHSAAAKDLLLEDVRLAAQGGSEGFQYHVANAATAQANAAAARAQIEAIGEQIAAIGEETSVGFDAAFSGAGGAILGLAAGYGVNPAAAVHCRLHQSNLRIESAAACAKIGGRVPAE